MPLNEKAVYNNVNDDQQKRIDDIRLIFSKVYDCMNLMCKPRKRNIISYN